MVPRLAAAVDPVVTLEERVAPASPNAVAGRLTGWPNRCRHRPSWQPPPRRAGGVSPLMPWRKRVGDVIRGLTPPARRADAAHRALPDRVPGDPLQQSVE